MSFKATTWGSCLCPCFVEDPPADLTAKDERKDERAPAVAGNGNAGSEKESTPATPTCSTKWTSAINTFHSPLLWLLRKLSSVAARFPVYTIAFMSLLAIGLFTSAMFTSFYLETEETVLWTPQHSQSMIDSRWVASRGYMGTGYYLTLFFHANGENVLGRKQVERVFAALDRIRAIPGYDDMCQYSWYVDRTGKRTCEIEGVTRFFGSKTANFWKETSTDEDVIERISEMTYPDGYPIREDRIYGKPERSEETDLLESLESYFLYIYLPYHWSSDVFEEQALEQVLQLKDEWKAQDERTGETIVTIEVEAARSFNDEFVRGIFGSIYLVGLVAVAMIAFTCIVFYKRHRLHSRILVGLAAVVSVTLSMMTGFGISMYAGVPFTTVTIIVPFILFGIGMDDAFVIYGDYSRTDRRADPVQRVKETIDDVGISITLTSITSAFAFGIGCISEIPAVSWLCYYAFPTVISVYIYQITFFVAALVIDERRIKTGRQDPFFCLKYKGPTEKNEIVLTGSSDSEGEGDIVSSVNNGARAQSRIDTLMVAYGNFLLQPTVKIAVVLVFTLFAVLAAISTSKIRQEFSQSDVIPDDSYLADFYAARKAYGVVNQMQAGVYFRGVDQSDKAVQEEMKEFVADLVELDGISGEPDFFWLTEFEVFVNNTPFVQNLGFSDQLGFFLGVPLYAELFRPDIRLDGDGSILSSRVIINMYDLDSDDVSAQIDMLKLQREISEQQPVNKGAGKDLLFFTSSWEYNEWEFYSAVVQEMTLTALLGISVVTGLAVILIPHWTAGVFVFFIMAIMYIDLLGIMQWGGVPVNAVSYVTLAMAIGLMVDFIMHVLLRYYESPGNRQEKMVEMLRTMGSSILIGGISTFLGTVPLAFSTYDMFRTVFVIFVGLVTVGLAHGMILLPVILSTIGTEEQVTTKAHSTISRVRTAAESVSSNESHRTPVTLPQVASKTLEGVDDATAYLISCILAQSGKKVKRIEGRPDPPNKDDEAKPVSRSSDPPLNADLDERLEL